MALVFFSGGIDSTVLAFDVAKSPWRYGIDPRIEILHLLTISFGKTNEKRGQLLPLFRKIKEVSKFPSIQHRIVECPLESFHHYDQPSGGIQGNHVVASEYMPDRVSIPFTPGLHLWIASFAHNMLWMTKDVQSYSPTKAFFGFQYDGPIWARNANKKIPPNDTSPQWVAVLNKIIQASGPNCPMEVKAPFLDMRMDRGHVVQLGLENGTPLLETSSCEMGWKVDCGTCSQCSRRNKAFKYFKVIK